MAKVTDAGADDFLVKPFTLVEFAARVRTMLRKRPPRESSLLQFADVTLDTLTHEVFRSGAPIPLTPKEFQLLEALLRSAGRLVPRNKLITKLWPVESVAGNTLDAFIRLLRNKIDQGRPVKLIHTVRGIGYRLSDDPK